MTCHDGRNLSLKRVDQKAGELNTAAMSGNVGDRQRIRTDYIMAHRPAIQPASRHGNVE